MLRVLIVALLTLSSSVSISAQQSRGKVDVPVMAGGGEYDACPSTGTIVGLDPQGDGFLSVRSGPGGPKYREIDRVYNGMHVYICDQKGPWYAVVYSNDNRAECNVSSSWTRRLPYTGPCRYGWIHSKYVGDLAG